MFVRGREVKFGLVGDKAFKPPNVYWFAFSAALIVMSIVALITLGLNLGIEFKGGYLVKLQLDEPANVEDVRDILGRYSSEGLDKAIVQTAEDGYVLTLRMPFIEDATTRNETIKNVENQLDEKYGIAETIQEEQVGSEWGQEISRKALIALGVFVVLIIIFITFRLEFKMAITGIIALVHDTLISVGIYALTGRQVTPVTVIAFLTILGYSLYDTIVVFDRIEENTNLLSKSGRVAYSDIVNDSVNQTLMRSIGTTLTTLLPIATILIFGGETLKDFAFALLLGVSLGAYSSVFLASPLLAIWKESEPRYATVREKVVSKGAKEAILITRPAQAATRGRKSEALQAFEVEKAVSATATKPAPSRNKPPASKAKKSTTKGPSGGKKKKKKKKK
ncbi:MAG: protein-export membrane protein SecF [Actinobacteria bacterium RBG_19FT_COMBO_54_7]|uniref:Protein-export membrane protein SecF n=1 Tax=Candidatus Solincola sediminis TaxID=1797199 RepID=A0A1F2WFP5_9ACTN|nr:MAG: protein-export membrane protein SecF [Candidatus Solincola sediminis]OFW58099.1 MAG: protein-export membrane protein SecF [Candidatus Solincola sediminis]OFW66097.1 MAG: protein-export membrane protein SecF [Actinobacteria bacterium RBG_19FT_COMBO_54_7]